MVVEYLELVDPPASRTAADRYGCFLAASEEEYSKACLEDARLDARGASQRVDATRAGCERVLAELQAKRYEYWDLGDAERHFNAERNAEVVISAQQFYAKRLTEPDVTWSVRDQHMSQGVLKLRQDLELLRGAPPRVAPRPTARGSRRRGERASPSGATSGRRPSAAWPAQRTRLQ